MNIIFNPKKFETSKPVVNFTMKTSYQRQLNLVPTQNEPYHLFNYF